MTLISTLNLSIKDGSTIASTEIYGVKTYINIGSGNVFKLEWRTPTLTNDTVDRYNLVIKRHDTTLNIYYDILDKNIGLVNEFYVDSYLLPTIPTQYMLSVYLIAYGKNGSIVTSNIINPYVSKGSGIYVNAQPAGYNESIMKRALAFANVQTQAESISALIDAEGEQLDALDGPLEATVIRVLSNDAWNIMQEGYVRADDGTWKTSDIEYEILVDETGEIITDSSNEPIYVQ